MKLIFILLCLFTFKTSLAQSYFEGEISYRESREKKDSSFDLSQILSYPSTQTTFYFKKGKWVHQLDTSIVEYIYFDHARNHTLYKIRGLDTLFYKSDESRVREQDSVFTITTQERTDTILNKVCNRLILKTAKLTVTFMYSPDIKINPDWFSKTKGAYYNIIYSKMRSLYLGLILETDQYIARSIATKVVYKNIPDSFFLNKDAMPRTEM